MRGIFKRELTTEGGGVMGDVVELKTKRKHKCSDPDCETMMVKTSVVWEWVEEITAVREVKKMSLWDRIFNWPY